MPDNYRSFDVKAGLHGSTYEEWAPHTPQTEKTFEWWYLTCILDDESGNKLFSHVMLFHFCSPMYLKAARQAPDSGPGLYKALLGLSDYARDLRLEDQTLARVATDFDSQRNAMRFLSPAGELDWSYRDGEMKVEGRSAGQELNLTLRQQGGPLWAKDHIIGCEGLIAESAREEPSFYYSLPTLNVTGTVSYRVADGGRITTQVTGQGWCDRQWGDFLTKSWEWCSLRFFDGDRVNLYAFPQTGHKIGSLMSQDGEISHFYDKFKVTQKAYFEAVPDVWLACEWEYEIPAKGRKYRVVSASKKDLVVSPINVFLEGMGYIYDEEGALVGFSVNESMDLKVTGTGPYKNTI